MQNSTGPDLKTPSRWRRFGVFGVVTLTAWLSAWILMRHYAAELFNVPDGTVLLSRDNILQPIGDKAGAKSPVDRQMAQKKPSKYEYMSSVLGRNIFDSTDIGQAPTVEPGGDFMATDLDVVLVATIVAQPQSESSALIADLSGSGRPRAYYIGDSLMGDGEIIAILGREHATLKEGRRPEDLPELSMSIRGHPPRVLILRNGNTEVLEMTGEGYDGKKKPQSSRGSKEDEMVTQAGPNKFIVAQSLIDKITADPEALTGEVRVSASKGSDGQVVGFRLSGIRRRSMFKQLGIKNGDIVHSVNGQTLNDANKAAEAYGSLQGVSNFTFEVTRRNERQIFEYEVQ